MGQSPEDSRQGSAQLRPEPSAVFGVQRRLYEAEAEQDNLRIQLSSVVSQFRARENWWRVNVTESKNQVIAGVFQNHQFELEARQQWEQRLRNVESLVDEAVSYTGDQALALHNRSESVMNLESQLATMHSNASSEVARLSQQVLEENKAIARYRGEVHALRQAATAAENQVAVAHGTAHSSTAELRNQLQHERTWRAGFELQNQELVGRTETQELELVQTRSIELVKRDVRVGELTHELNVLRSDHSTITAELRTADSARTSTVTLRIKLLDSEARCNKEADKARAFEAELRASRYDCDHLREEVKEWEDQAQEQQQGDWFGQTIILKAILRPIHSTLLPLEAEAGGNPLPRAPREAGGNPLPQRSEGPNQLKLSTCRPQWPVPGKTTEARPRKPKRSP